MIDLSVIVVSYNISCVQHIYEVDLQREAAIDNRVRPFIRAESKNGSGGADVDKKTNVTSNSWKSKFDNNQVYNIDKSFQ